MSNPVLKYVRSHDDTAWSLKDPSIFSLEPRIMFDGAMAADVVAAVTDAGDSHQSQDASSPASSHKEVAIIDPTVQGYQAIVSALPDNVETQVLKAGATLDDIADILSGMEGVDAIHLITHGDVGTLSLGGQTLDGAGLDANETALRTIGSALTDNGDILLYGCRIGTDGQGTDFIDRLAQKTGADVAASDDATGAKALGGDWILENRSGDIETKAFVVDGYDSLLAVTTPVVGGGGSTSYLESNDPAIVVASSLSVASGSNYGDGGSLKIQITGAQNSETLALTTVGTASTTNGVVSVVGSRVYLGDGTTANEVGQISSSENGASGATLTINFTGLGLTTAISNGGFETGDLTNWTAVNSQIVLGTTAIDGVVTPTDTTIANNSGGDGDVPSTLGSLTSVVSSTDKTTGTYALQLKSSGMTTQNGFDVVHGPAVYSDSFAATSGQRMNFDWRALGGSDAYDVFGYIQKSDGTQTTILDQTGSSSSGSTPWATSTVTIPSDGNYRFVFVSGTYDFSGGKAAGASLYIDNIAVYNSTPGIVTNQVVQDIARLVTYKNTSVTTGAERTVTFTVTQKDGNNASTTATISDVVPTVETTPAPPPVADTPKVEAPAVDPAPDTGGNDAPQTFVANADQGTAGLQTFVGNANPGAAGLQTFVGGTEGAGTGEGGAGLGGTLGTGTQGGAGEAGGTLGGNADFGGVTGGTTGTGAPAGPQGGGDVGPATAQGGDGAPATGVGAAGTRGQGDGPNASDGTTTVGTTATGFPVSVAKIGAAGQGDGGNLVVMNGISDVATTADGVSFRIPADAFAVTRADSVVQLSAAQSDGTALPAWLGFSAETGQFTGTPPQGFTGVIDVSVFATDENGNRVSTTFSLIVGDGGGRNAPPPAGPQTPAGNQQGDNGNGNKVADAHGRASFTDQVAQAGEHGRHLRQAALIQALEAAKHHAA